MSDNTTNKNVRDDEIDLLDLFRRMGNGIAKMSRAIGNAILATIVFMLKKWIPLTISVILGIAAAYILKFTAPSFYTSDLVLRSNAVGAADVIEYVNRLNTYSKEKNTLALSQALGMQADQLKNINNIKAHWIIDLGRDGIPDRVDLRDRHDVYDTVNLRMTDRLDIRVNIKEPQELNRLKDGLLSYIRSDSLFQQRNRLRIRQNTEMLARISYDIEQLDSLQQVKYFEETRARTPQGGGQMIFLQEQNTQLVYPDIHSLYTNKQRYETENEIYRDVVTILSDFSIPAMRVNGGGFYAIRTVPIAFGLMLLILILIANRKKLEEIYTKY